MDKIYLLIGNDTPLAVCLRKSEGEETPVPYDLSEARRLRLALVGHGMRVFAKDIEVSGDDNNVVSGMIPGRSLLKGDYDLEVTFNLDGRDKRFAVKDMFEAVDFLAEDADGEAEGEGAGIFVTVTVQPELIEISGPAGPQGKSAYQVWLDDGHTGTEDDFFEWLAAQTPNPDWNQNDSTKADFIKNRTHYEETSTIKIDNALLAWSGSTPEDLDFWFHGTNVHIPRTSTGWGLTWQGGELFIDDNGFGYELGVYNGEEWINTPFDPSHDQQPYPLNVDVVIASETVHKLDNKYLDLDSTPTLNSQKPVTSDGVKRAMPTVPVISTNVEADGTSDTKTSSPKSVKTFVEGKGYYTKPQSGIPASDIAAGVIPTVPTDIVKYTSQSLTDAQKEQARTNIGAASDSEVSQLRSDVDDLDGQINGSVTPDTDVSPTVQTGYYYLVDTHDTSILTITAQTSSRYSGTISDTSTPPTGGVDVSAYIGRTVKIVMNAISTGSGRCCVILNNSNAVIAYVRERDFVSENGAYSKTMVIPEGASQLFVSGSNAVSTINVYILGSTAEGLSQKITSLEDNVDDIEDDISNVDTQINGVIVPISVSSGRFSRGVSLAPGKYYVTIEDNVAFVRLRVYDYVSGAIGTTILGTIYQGANTALVTVASNTDGIWLFSETYSSAIAYNVKVSAVDDVFARTISGNVSLSELIQYGHSPVESLFTLQKKLNTAGTISDEASYRCTDYLYWDGLSKIRYDGLNSSYAIIGYFDADKTFISAVAGGGAYDFFAGEATPPAGTKYVVFCTTYANLDRVKVAFVNSLVGLGSNIDWLKTQVAVLGENILPLQGKKIVTIGDSITEFKGTDGYSYPEHLAMLTGATVINIGIGGSCLRERGTPVIDQTEPFSSAAYAALDMVNIVRCACGMDYDENTSYLELAETAAEYIKNNSSDDNTAQVATLAGIDWSEIDYVIVMGGTNDWHGGTTTKWGSLDSQDPTKTYGAINYIIDKLLSTYKNLQLYWVNPIVRWLDYAGPNSPLTLDSNWGDVYAYDGVTLKQFAANVFDIVKANHIPVLDIYNTLGWNKYNFSRYFNDDDGTHPRKGFAYIARAIMRFIS